MVWRGLKMNMDMNLANDILDKATEELVSAQQVVIIDVPPEREVVLHKGHEPRPNGGLPLRNIVILGQRLVDNVVEPLLAELGAQLGREVVVLLRRAGLDLQPGAQFIAVLRPHVLADLREELDDERHCGRVAMCAAWRSLA